MKTPPPHDIPEDATAISSRAYYGLGAVEYYASGMHYKVFSSARGDVFVINITKDSLEVVKLINGKGWLSMEIKAKYIGKPAKIIELIVESDGTRVEEYITNLSGYVDRGLISTLRRLADDFEEHNQKMVSDKFHN